jgi:hypothetical protein
MWGMWNGGGEGFWPGPCPGTCPDAVATPASTIAAHTPAIIVALLLVLTMVEPQITQISQITKDKNKKERRMQNRRKAGAELPRIN